MTRDIIDPADATLQSETAYHYDTTPFDFLTEEDEAQIAAVQPWPFQQFVRNRIRSSDLIAEIGCGPGRATLYLSKLDHKVVAVDLSVVSIKLARKRVSDAHFVAATNLALPFLDESFDVVISDGVIHHTPDAERAFYENARILKSGGILYLGIYRQNGYYYWLYKYLGIPIRWLEKKSWGRPFVMGFFLPIYYLAHLIKTRGKRTWNGAKSFFYDYIITPRATFHTRGEIKEWGERAGLSLQEYFGCIGNTHVFVFSKLIQ